MPIRRGIESLRRILGVDAEEEVRSELEFHLLMRIRDLQNAGMDPAAAREKARRDFGDVDAIGRECRAIAKRRNRTARRREWFGELRQDGGFALRQIARSPGFALVAVLTLALGIGGSTAIFSVVSGVLLRSLPYPRPERLVAVRQVSADGTEGNFSHPNFLDVRERSRSFSALAEYASTSAPVIVGQSAARVPVAWVSADFFPTLGVGAVLGRTFLPGEFGTDEPVAVVSDAFWRQHLGASRDLAGRTIRVNDRTLTVVGVLAPGVGFPAEAGIWRPQGAMKNASRIGHNWQVLGRMRPGVSPPAASRELNEIARALQRQYGDDTMMAGAAVAPLHAVIVGGVRPALLVLLGASGLLLLIACANVASLLLARTAARRRELALRVAMGAGRARMMRQFVAESLVLTLPGAALGALLAFLGVRTLVAQDPGRLPRAGEIHVDTAALLFALTLSAAAAVGIGLVVAPRASRSDLREPLAGGFRAHLGGAAGQRVRSTLAVAQVALTLVLLVAAGLLARSFLRLIQVDPGYRTEGALVMDIVLPTARTEAERSHGMRIQHELLTRLAAIPGVRAAGSVNILPLGGGGDGSTGPFLKMEGTEAVDELEELARLLREPGRAGEADYRVADGGYFPAMGIPLLRGRLFDGRDAPGAATHAAVVSRSLAERAWPGQDPIGKRVQYGGMDLDMTPFTVVGVVGDVRERALDAAPRPVFYANVRQRPAAVSGPRSIVLHGGDASAVRSAARAILREAGPGIPARFRTLDQVFATSLADRRFSLLLLGIFALTALVLAITGIYGIIAYGVAQRTREIGIRLALGARPEAVLGMVLRGGLILGVAGVAVGLAIALAATRLLSGLLYGIGATDPVTLTAVPLLLLAVVALAGYVPARRTTRVDPVIAIRAE